MVYCTTLYIVISESYCSFFYIGTGTGKQTDEKPHGSYYCKQTFSNEFEKTGENSKRTLSNICLLHSFTHSCVVVIESQSLANIQSKKTQNVRSQRYHRVCDRCLLLSNI